MINPERVGESSFSFSMSPLWPWVLGMAGLFLTFYQSLLSGFRFTEHDGIDSRLNNYILEHGWRWLTGHALHGSFWDPPIFFPERNTAAYTDVLLGTAPVYWAWRAVGLAPDTAFHAWAIATVLLNFLTAFLVLRYVLNTSNLAAALGAFLFAFAGARMARLGHMQLHQHAFAMFTITAIAQLFGSDRRASERLWLAVLFASVVGQFYSSFYLAWFLCFALALATLWSLVFADTRRLLAALVRRRAVTLQLLMAVTALALWPLASHYLAAGDEVGFRLYLEANSPGLLSWIFMSPDNRLYGWMASAEPFRSLPGPHEEQWLGVGLATTVMAIVGLWSNRAIPGVRVLLLTGCSLILLASRLPLSVEPWQYVYKIAPGANALRAPARIGLMMLVPIAIGAAFWLQGRRKWWAAAMAALVMASEQVQSMERFDRLAIGDAGSRSTLGIRAGQCDAFLYTPADRGLRTNEVHTAAMFGQLEAGIPTLNGYSGHTPPEWPFHDTRTETVADRQRLDAGIEQWASRHGLRAERICRTTGRAE